MIRFLLTFVDLFRWLYEMMGVNFGQLKTIVATKMLMDNRRTTLRFNQKSTNESSNSFLWTLAIYTILGAFLAYIVFAVPSFLIAMSIYHSYVIVMVSLTLISDFSSVLLDTSDNTIILPRPVSSYTLLAARVTHIVLYIVQIMGALALLPIIFCFVKFGVGMGLLIILTTLLSTSFSLMLTNGLYLLLMRFTSEEKLKTIINYFQIVMATLMMGAYQFLPRMITNNLLGDTFFVLPWWSLLAPPLWMAGFLEIFYSHSYSWIHIVCGLFAFSFSLGGFYFISKYFSSSFAEKLADLGTSTAVTPNKQVKMKSSWSGLFKLKELITSPGIERGAFELTTAALMRDRKLKLKIYPSIGYLFILAAILLFNKNEPIEATLANLHSRSIHIIIIYSGFLMIQTIMAQIAISDDFKAGWVYSAAPIVQPGHILMGAWKAVLSTFFLPIYLLFTIFISIIWRVNAVDDLIFGFVGNILVSLVAALLSEKYFPLSMEPSVKNQSGNFIKVMATIILIGAVGAGHFFLAKLSYGLLVGFPILIVLTAVLYNRYKNISWSKITY